MSDRVALLLVGVGCLLLAGCPSTPQRVEDGEQLLAEEKWDEAAAVFREVLLDPQTKGLDLDRAAVGEARAFLGKKDLVGAETRLRRLKDELSAKWYWLGHVALERKDLAQAREHFQRALDQTHGEDTALLLARLLGREARTTRELIASAKVLKRGGQGKLGGGVEQLAEVWRRMLVGDDPQTLMKSFEEHVTKELRSWGAVCVLEARLLDRAGRRKDASAAWGVAGLKPRPSDAFIAYASELRAEEALRSGDAAALEETLEDADPETAARIRSRVAEARSWWGDLEGALGLYERTEKGASAPLARAEAAMLLRTLGRAPEAEKQWKAAGAGSSSSSRLRALLAQRRVARGDLLGAAELLRKADPADRHIHERYVRAGALLRVACQAHAAGQGSWVRATVRAVQLLVPTEPASQALLDRSIKVEGVRGQTLVVLLGARLTRLLRTGELKRAGELLAAHPRVDLKAIVARELHEGVVAALRSDREAQAEAFLRRHAKYVPTNLAACTCCAPFPKKTLSGRRGLEAAGSEWGRLVSPSGWELPLVRVAKKGQVQLSGGGSGPLAAKKDLRWTSHPHRSAEEIAERVKTARTSGVLPAPLLELD